MSITHHCRECGIEYPDGNNTCHPAAIVDSIVSTSHPTATPLADALNAAIVAADLADQAWLNDDSCDSDDKTHPAWIATESADLARDAARAALAGSTEPRAWKIACSGVAESITATSLEDALRQAEANVRDCDWSSDGDGADEQGTTYVDVRVTCDLTGETDSVTVDVQPKEPDCADGCQHHWKAPIELVGGIAVNPGVVGHGGGVVMHEICAHCGVHRHTDTWATRRDTGEQGLVKIRYSEPDADSLAWVTSRK